MPASSPRLTIGGPIHVIKSPQALHHTSVVRRFSDLHSSFTVRTLLFRKTDGTVELYAPFIEYLRQHRFRSTSWQDNRARALGLFWDFCIAHERDGYSPQDLFRNFAYALLEGTVDSPLVTSRSLLWPSISRDRAIGLVKCIEDFAEWCSSKYDETSPIAPEQIALVRGTGEHTTRLLMWARLRRISMLQHIKRAPPLVRQSIVDFGRPGRNFDVEAALFFPPEHAERLLWEGYKRASAASHPNIFLRYMIRDMMIALLDGWGGLRESEALHLWVGDVTDDPHLPGHALVVLNHPAEAKVSSLDPISRKIQAITRKELLKRMYGLRPRNVVNRGPYHVGWKGMALNRDHQACIFWIDQNAGALFLTLYFGYLRFVRAPTMQKRLAMGGRDHPFLFVSEEASPASGLPGEPCSKKAYERSHKAAVRRIGLDHSKAAGTTTQALRHLYGQTMQKLGVPAQVIQRGLHHCNLLSQAVYTAPSKATINRALREAQQHLASGQLPLAPLQSDTSAAILKLRQSLVSGGFYD